MASHVQPTVTIFGGFLNVSGMNFRPDILESRIFTWQQFNFTYFFVSLLESK